MRKKHYLYLTGGLGNQLFQLAAALDLAISSEDSLIIDTVIGKPRVTDNLADIFHLKITDEIGSFSRKANILSSKAAGFLLRLGINPVGLEKNKFVGNFFKFAGEAVLSCRFRINAPGCWIDVRKNRSCSDIANCGGSCYPSNFRNNNFITWTNS